ncbi:MAG TPA: helix-turn-helix domain-containing protein [Verrucomicrobiae bacterium]|jgi:cytoskeletal protein RodZ|nr:helix-turn-helix domain-containing protein [Verrucomicrobiae bacterium]
MTTVAEQLQRAREVQSLSINQVAEVTKIRTDHIRAIEEGNFDIFAAPVYIRGFVRTYALMLKLDVGDIMSALDKELGKTEKFREPPPLSEHKRGILDFLTLQLSKLNWRIAFVGVAGLVVVGIIYFCVSLVRHHHRADPLSNLTPGTYQPSTSGETVPLPPTHR